MNAPVKTKLVIEGEPVHQVRLTEAQIAVLRRLEQQLPTVTMPAVLSWRMLDTDGSRIEVGMSDTTDSTRSAVHREYKADWVTGSDASGLVHLEVMSDLAAQRSAASARRVERSFAELEAARDGEAGD